MAAHGTDTSGAGASPAPREGLQVRRRTLPWSRARRARRWAVPPALVKAVIALKCGQLPGATAGGRLLAELVNPQTRCRPSRQPVSSTWTTACCCVRGGHRRDRRADRLLARCPASSAQVRAHVASAGATRGTPAGHGAVVRCPQRPRRVLVRDDGPHRRRLGDLVRGVVRPRPTPLALDGHRHHRQDGRACGRLPGARVAFHPGDRSRAARGVRLAAPQAPSPSAATSQRDDCAAAG